jgi:hypothetical protein
VRVRVHSSLSIALTWADMGLVLFSGPFIYCSIAGYDRLLMMLEKDILLML